MTLKNHLLTLMEHNRGEIFSGTELAEKFGVSRNAVFKAINALRDEGHTIQSVGRRGYMMSCESDALSAEAVKSYLDKKYEDVKIFVSNQVDSTNDEARRFELSDSSRAVFIADSQTDGKGRFGRSFYSPPKTGLYLSAVFHPDCTIAQNTLYTVAAAVAAARAIENVTGISVSIKWVNDLYLEEKKICGVLTEAVTDFETGQVHTLVIGIGINVTTENFPPALREKAASLKTTVNRNRLAAKIIDELYGLIGTDVDFMNEYRKRCFIIGKQVTFMNGNVHLNGKVMGVSEKCELILETDDGLKYFSYGEITDF